MAANASVALAALVDDTDQGGSTIASAEFSWDGGSTWEPMTGAFNAVSVSVSASFDAPEEAGLYDVCVRGTDSEGNTGPESCIQLVVYDPSAGFVTGGGWILSPPGAMQITATPWSQDFSLDDAGWFDGNDNWYGNIMVNGGTALMEGSNGSGPFSRFDDFRSEWPGAWKAEIDVYLDPSWSDDQGFDYSVAASGTDGGHQRDYIFHVGTVEDYGPITGKALLVNGSNNTDFQTNPYKLVNENGGNYYTVAAAGWYTLQHVFRDAGGYLAVDLNLLDAGGNLLWSVTRSSAADLIPDEVGGNRYSWFTHIDVADGILVDNHELHIGPQDSPEAKANFGFVAKYKKGASVPSGNTEFSFEAGGLDFHSSSYEWLVVNQGDKRAQFKGEGTINDTGDYKFMLWAGDLSDGDEFRIKIWSEDGGTETVVFDNGVNQKIGGGNIMIHAGNSKNMIAGSSGPAGKTVTAAPNPFTDRIAIGVELQEEADLSLLILNSAGQRVRTIHSGLLPSGFNRFDWDGRADNGSLLPSGIYFYQLAGSGRLENGRIVLKR